MLVLLADESIAEVCYPRLKESLDACYDPTVLPNLSALAK
jgi:hypothetical protein